MWFNEKFPFNENSFRVCIRCGAFSASGGPFFCAVCEEGLNKWRLNELQAAADLKFPVYALFAWTEPSDSFIRPMIYAMKGGRCAGHFTKLANEFSWRMKVGAGDLNFVVPPRKANAKKDHALVWAQALARIWDGDVIDCLAYPNDREADSQKKKDVESRSNRSFSLVKNANLLSQGRIIFADDILTTGSTARAAFKALGEPKGFEVWAIAWRPKLAAKPSF